VVLSERAGIPAFDIGATVVGFGTSTPELLVSLDAAPSGVPGVAIGNVVGSDVANISLILGVTAAMGTIVAPWAALRSDLIWMLGAAILGMAVLLQGEISRLEGGLLLAAFTIYLIITLRRRSAPTELSEAPSAPVWRGVLLVTAGLAAVMLGSRALVDSATVIALSLGVSNAVIGLTLVAVGTSLPELATSISAALRGQRDIALGNIVGSNIFNILAILGVTALVTPVPVAPRLAALDAPVMVLVTLVLLGLVALLGRITRPWAASLLAAYLFYLGTMAAI